MKTIRIFGWEVRVRRAPVGVAGAVEAEGRRMDDAALRAAFCMTENDPRWRAIRQLVQGAIDASATQAISPYVASDHGLLAHSAGCVAGLRQFLDGLTEIRERAMEDTEN